MSITEKMCAIVSAQCYDRPGRRLSEIKVSWKGQEETLILDTSMDAVQYCVYTVKSASSSACHGGIAILGFKGTDSLKDIKVDGKLTTDGLTPVNLFGFGSGDGMEETYHAEVDLAVQQFCENYATSFLYVTGHSLGGAYALRAGDEIFKTLRRPVKLHVFNCAPRSLRHQHRVTAATTTHTAGVRCTHHHILNDLISCMTGNALGLEKLTGNWKTVTYNAHPNAKGNHTIVNFIQGVMPVPLGPFIGSATAAGDEGSVAIRNCTDRTVTISTYDLKDNLQLKAYSNVDIQTEHTETCRATHGMGQGRCDQFYVHVYDGSKLQTTSWGVKITCGYTYSYHGGSDLRRVVT